MTSAQLPYVREPAQDAGDGLWKQQVLPLGSVTHPKLGELEFSREVLEELVATFESGAMDVVSYTLVDGDGRHTSDPARVRGEIRRLELADDGLYAVIAPSERGRELLRENPRQPVSARITIPDAGPFAGRPVLAHVAATPDPVARGMAPGQWVDASNTGELLIDLSNAEWDADEFDLSDAEVDAILAEFAPSPSPHEIREAADAMYRDWTGEPAPPKPVELSNSPEAKLQRQIDATLERYGFGGGY